MTGNEASTALSRNDPASWRKPNDGIFVWHKDAQPISSIGTTATAFVSGPKKLVYFALSGVLLCIAAIGVVLPGLPTTPFLLLASFLLSRCWPRGNEFLIGMPVFGPILSHWQNHQALERSTKTKAMVFVAIALPGIACFSSFSTFWMLVLLGLALLGLMFIHRIPTFEKNESTASVLTVEQYPLERKTSQPY